MNNILLITLLLIVAGCAGEGERFRSYLDHPEYLIKDPHYEEYQEVKDNLERQYLRKDISYADYMQKVSELDDQYSREVHKRNEIVVPSQTHSDY